MSKELSAEELAKQLIKEILEDWNGLERASIEYYFQTGKVSGSLFLALKQYAERFAAARLEAYKAELREWLEDKKRKAFDKSDFTIFKYQELLSHLTPTTDENK